MATAYDIYMQKTGHAPDAEGLKYWEGRLAAGEDIGTAITNAITPENKAGWASGAYKAVDPPSPVAPVPVTPPVTPTPTPVVTPTPTATTTPTVAPTPTPVAKKDPVKVISVEDSMNGLLSGNSTYIKQARQAGVDLGASRGLLNSSIAAGAAEKSAIEAALPIAQQDAGYTQDLGRTEAQEAASSNLSNQDYMQDWNTSEHAAEIAAQAAAIKAAADKEANDNTIALQKWQEEQQQAGANFRAEQTNAANLAMNSMDLDAEGRTQVSGIINDASNDLQADVMRILADTNTDRTAKESQIAAAKTLYNDRIQDILDVYKIPIVIPNLDDIANPSNPDSTSDPDAKPAKDVTTNRSVISGIYAKYGFPADETGFDYWTAQLNDGTLTTDTIEAAIKSAGDAVNKANQDYANGLLNPGGTTVIPQEEENKDTRTPEEKLKDMFDGASNGK